jgi:hypothetical protein
VEVREREGGGVVLSEDVDEFELGTFFVGSDD